MKSLHLFLSQEYVKMTSPSGESGAMVHTFFHYDDCAPVVTIVWHSSTIIGRHDATINGPPAATHGQVASVHVAGYSAVIATVVMSVLF